MNNNTYVDIIGMLVFWHIFGEDKVMRMPILYLAKVNVNSIIYDVYNNKVSLEQIKDELFAGLQNGGLVTAYVKMLTMAEIKVLITQLTE